MKGLTATAGTALPPGADGPVLTVTVRITAEPSARTTMKNVAYVAPLPEDEATDLDGDGYADVIAEHLNPLVVPTLDTDTDRSDTDNDAQGVWTVEGAALSPHPVRPPPQRSRLRRRPALRAGIRGPAAVWRTPARTGRQQRRPSVPSFC